VPSTRAGSSGAAPASESCGSSPRCGLDPARTWISAAPAGLRLVCAVAELPVFAQASGEKTASGVGPRTVHRHGYRAQGAGPAPRLVHVELPPGAAVWQRPGGTHRSQARMGSEGQLTFAGRPSVPRTRNASPHPRSRSSTSCRHPAERDRSRDCDNAVGRGGRRRNTCVDRGSDGTVARFPNPPGTRPTPSR